MGRASQLIAFGILTTLFAAFVPVLVATHAPWPLTLFEALLGLVSAMRVWGAWTRRASGTRP